MAESHLTAEELAAVAESIKDRGAKAAKTKAAQAAPVQQELT